MRHLVTQHHADASIVARLAVVGIEEGRLQDAGGHPICIVYLVYLVYVCIPMYS